MADDAGEWIVYKDTADDEKSKAAFEGPGKDNDSTHAEQADFGEKAEKIAAEVAARVQEIEQDPDIPVRASKKNPTNKKIAREQAHQQAATRLHNLAVDCKDTVGKWLFYITTDNIDPVWEKIARAIVEPEGVLRGKAISAKTSPYQLQEKPTHVICVYIADSWDKKIVGDVFEILVRKLGLVSNAYKADVYTAAGIDSKHPSKMKSTLYNKKDFMTDQEVTDALEARKKPLDAEGKPKEVKVTKAQAQGTGFLDDDSDATEGSGDDASKKEAPVAKKQKKA
ncbi:hypothetical protein EMMF5_002430 [Cystobasidiomycetes sp. EMM_F5]